MPSPVSNLYSVQILENKHEYPQKLNKCKHVLINKLYSFSSLRSKVSNILVDVTTLEVYMLKFSSYKILYSNLINLKDKWELGRYCLFWFVMSQFRQSVFMGEGGHGFYSGTDLKLASSYKNAWNFWISLLNVNIVFYIEYINPMFLLPMFMCSWSGRGSGREVLLDHIPSLFQLSYAEFKAKVSN